MNDSRNEPPDVNEAIKFLLIRVLDRMLRARWLRDYTFTTSKGFHLGWYPEGARKAVCLKLISTSFGLSDDDRAPLGFDIVAHSDPVPDWMVPFPMDDAVARYWCHSIEELRLRNDGHGLFALVQIVENWAPDLNTPVTFTLGNDPVLTPRGTRPGVDTPKETLPEASESK